MNETTYTSQERGQRYLSALSALITAQDALADARVRAILLAEAARPDCETSVLAEHVLKQVHHAEAAIERALVRWVSWR